MNPTRLPDGFAVQIDRRVRVLGHGSALLGGSPTRLLRLAPTAQTMLSEGRLEVCDAMSAQLARTLLDATVAHPRPSSGPSHRDVTVVVPVRDNDSGLHRLMSSLRGVRIIVVDDGSTVPISRDRFDEVACDVTVIRHARSSGPAAARNTGLAASETDYVAFLDSDVVPHKGWLEALLGHFCDPAVALVAPRIVSLMSGDHLVARYESVRSSLDLGRREAPVVPYGTVSYVPSAALVGRRSALGDVGGFDETLHSGEDVDLCWRLMQAGDRLRYEPIALVAHDHRVAFGDWLARKAFYGRSAAPLSDRHPGNTAPLVISGWNLVLWSLLTLGSAVGYLASLAIAALVGHRVAKAMRGPETKPCDVAVVATRGLASAGLQLASAICRHYWPVAVLAAIVSRRCRRTVIIAAVVDGVADWRRHTSDPSAGSSGRPTGVLSHLVLKRLDDLAYGAGLWGAVCKHRNPAPLKPQIRA